jgi:alpha-D-ribose 1-methylphosphonate 5-triphosphate synthase subunit PhnL
MIHQQQQGDVLLKRVDKLPNGAKEVERKNGKVVVMHGESGHTHIISDVDAMFYEKDGKSYLVATKPVTLTHEEHHAQTIETGIWEVIQVREKDWLSGLVRKVID